jgi:hypothetical protein
MITAKTTSKDPFLVCTVTQRREFFVLYYAILVLEFRKQWIPRSVKIAHTDRVEEIDEKDDYYNIFNCNRTDTRWQ